MRTRRPVHALILLTFVALVLAPGRAKALSREDSAADGARWLASQQRSNGAFFSTSERPVDTADDLVAVVAGRVGGDTVKRALAYIAKNGKAATTRGAFTGRIIAGIVAGGGDPTDHGGTDFVEKLRAQYDAATGAYDDEQLFPNLVAANGALAAGDVLPDEAVDRIVANQCSSGGFGYENGCPKGADIDTTAWAINVLAAARRATNEVEAAREWLLTQQHKDGGFGFTKDKPTSADSTGLVLSAIAALDEDARATPWRQSDGDDPVKALAKLQRSSGGFSFVAGGKANGLSTRQAVPGMAGLAYPVPHLEPAPGEPTPTRRPESKDTDEPQAEDSATPRPDRTPSGNRPGAGAKAYPSASPSEAEKERETERTQAESFEPPQVETDRPPWRSPWVWGLGSALAIAGGGLGFRHLHKRP